MIFFKNKHLPVSDDLELVTLYRQTGDLDAVAQLFSRYTELLYAVCLKYLKDKESAKDAVLQIFEELTIKLKKHEPENFRGWLYVLAKNHCLMQLRKPLNGKIISMDTSFMQLAAEPHHEMVDEKEIHLKRLTKCIESLSEDQKKSVELFYLQEKCYKEIVDITGLQFNKIRSLIQNGRRNLKICMDKKVLQ